MAQSEPYVAITAGTHTWSPEHAEIDKIVETLRKHNIRTLDTARRYTNGGSEKTIGDRGLAQEFAVDTKANTHVNPGGGRQIATYAAQSLEALKTEKVRVYLLHGPDDSVPFSEQMDALQSLYAAGKFERLGLSNFSRAQVLEVYEYAKSKGYVLPTVYQSNYSLATRRLDTDIFPTLRELGISFQSYSPMAAGFLAKTPEYIQKGLGSWNPVEAYGRHLQFMFNTPSYMKMLVEFGKLSDSSGISRAGLAYRWVRHHSALDARMGDEMIIGASTAAQVEEALEELKAGPLEPWIVGRIDELWKMVEDDAPLGNNESAWKAFAPTA